jgi:hypothetical protein
MKKFTLLFLPAFVLCFVISCKHEPILPEQQVSFHNDILPILRGSCQHAGCHSPFDPNAEFPLDSVISEIHEYVDPGKPKNSEIYERITEEDESDRMPQAPYERLTQRQINLIYIWIGQGAQDN